jgi:hypothetical protein
VKKGGNLEVNELLASLVPQSSSYRMESETIKRGDRKKLMAREAMEAMIGEKEGGLSSNSKLVPSVASTSNAADISSTKQHRHNQHGSRNGRNQVLLNEGRVFASVHNLPLSIGMEGDESQSTTSTSKGMQFTPSTTMGSLNGGAVDPFELIHAHLSTVVSQQQQQTSSSAFSTHSSSYQMKKKTKKSR